VTTIRSFPVCVLVLAATACAVAAVPAASEWLSFDRAAILNGEIWRLVTGHLVHSSLYHLTWNLAGLAGLGWLFGRELGQRFLAVMFGGALMVSGGLILLDPGLELYVGLSGVLNTLLVAGALASWREERAEGSGFYGVACLVLIGLSLAKIVVEAGAGTSLFTDPGRLGGFAVPLAHALGALAGALLGGSQGCTPAGKSETIPGGAVV